MGERVEALADRPALAIALERRGDAVAGERGGLAAGGDDLDVVAVPGLGDVEAPLTSDFRTFGVALTS